MARAAAVLLVVLLSAPLVPVEAASSPAQRALAYLASVQREDGNFSGVRATNVVEAVAAAGLDPAAWPTREQSALDALHRMNARDHVAFKHDLRIAHALGASGYDPSRWRGGDLVQAIRAEFRDGQFNVTTDLNDDAFAILALRAAGVPAQDAHVQSAADFLLSARGTDGGWSYSRASPASSTDVTGFVLAALAAAERDVEGDERARLFLQGARDPLSGGYKDVVNAQAANCQSTLWALHARRLLGLPPDADAESFLLRLQRSDGGLRRTEADAASDAFCTAEAAVYLAGGRYPLPGFLPLPDAAPHAREPTTLPMPAGATRARWHIEGLGVAEGAAPVVTFPSAGAYAYRLDASGPGGRHRGEGVLLVRSARPLVALPPDVEALRNVPVAFGVEAGSDADGVVQAVQVDWGDGNVTPPAPAAERAFALPGDVPVRVRVRDDAGVWSAWGGTVVHVRNRAPVLTGVPPRLETDRLTRVELAVHATDPDGDGVVLVGAEPRTFPALGEHAWDVEVRDPHGGVATARVLVLVKNLAPRLENVTVPRHALPGEPVPLRARAHDADGNATRIQWRAGNETWDGASVVARLPAGTHAVTVEATDEDGGAARETHVIAVAAPEAAPARVPWIERLDAALTEDALVVEVDASPEAALRLSWTTDAGAGAATLDGPGRHEFPLPGATRATLRLVATLAGLDATRDATATRASTPPPLPPPAFDAPPERTRVGTPLRLLLVPLADAVEYAFEYGDGNASGWTQDAVGAHAYARSGTFEVVAHARAADGRASRASILVTVDPLPPRAPPLVPAPVEPAPVETRLEPQALTRDQAEPRREAPLPWSPLALLLAALGRRARRA